MCNPKCLSVHHEGHQQIKQVKNSNKNLLSCRKSRDTKANREANQAQPSSDHQPIRVSAIKGGPNPLARWRGSSERLAEGAGALKNANGGGPACVPGHHYAKILLGGT